MRKSALLTRLLKALDVCRACGEKYGDPIPFLIQDKTGRCNVCKEQCFLYPKNSFGNLFKGIRQLQTEIRDEAVAKVKERALKSKERADGRIKKVKEKVSKKSMKQLRAELRRITHKIVRLSSPTCYTCDKHIERWQEREAGHYFTQGAHGSVKFDWDNIRTQCNSCNQHKSGNLNEYAYRLRRELGNERFEALEERAHQIIKFNREELQTLIEERKETLKSLTE
jgi:hypothetical protein